MKNPKTKKLVKLSTILVMLSLASIMLTYKIAGSCIDDGTLMLTNPSLLTIFSTIGLLWVTANIAILLKNQGADEDLFYRTSLSTTIRYDQFSKILHNVRTDFTKFETESNTRWIMSDYETVIIQNKPIDDYNIKIIVAAGEFNEFKKYLT